MQVSGYQLKRALRGLERRRTLLLSQWQDSQWAFPGEDKPSPETVLAELRTCEEAVAKLQVVQARYNLTVRVTARTKAGEEAMSLLEAIKRVGGLGRLDGLAQKAAKSTENEYYFMQNQRSRDPDQEHAVRQLPLQGAARLATALGDDAEALREAIARGNEERVELDVEGLDPALLA